ncbi:hypothetical protein OC834_006130 [Tilletia horrida]|nr:hypothetical protein OC834_006130 [Tilletia horrida]KAK0526258.1 hypothetical protein OC835_005350 [Tilletia horrida]KAK0566280.1 hypothetical protein OC844_000815 [Tilletia horrida]
MSAAGAAHAAAAPASTGAAAAAAAASVSTAAAATKTADGTGASSTAPLQLLAVNPFLHVYDPSAGSTPSAAAETGKKSTAHLPSLVPGVRAPAVILICGFMDGSLRIMSKYAAEYVQRRFPSSTLILQLSTGKGLFAPPEERAARMRKIVALLERAQDRAESRRALRRRIRSLERNAAERSLDSTEQRRLRRLRSLQRRRSSAQSLGAAPASSGGEDETSTGGGVLEEDDEEDEQAAEETYLKPEERTPRGLLIHTFSDGGGRNLWALLNELSANSSSTTNPRLPPVRGVIMDSSPGLQTASTSSLAFTMPMRKKYAAWIVWLARASVWIWVRFALLWRVYVRRQPTDSERMRAALNSPSKWAWGWSKASDFTLDFQNSKHAAEAADAWHLPPRLYLYSRADALIPWNHVERHAKDAARIQAGGGGGGKAAEPELIVQEGEDCSSPSALQAAAKAGTVDPETAKWAELSAKFDSSFHRERTTSLSSATATSAGALSEKTKQGRTPPRGVRLVRWEKAPHCDIGRHDAQGYWAAVDDWLASV